MLNAIANISYSGLAESNEIGLASYDEFIWQWKDQAAVPEEGQTEEDLWQNLLNEEGEYTDTALKDYYHIDTLDSYANMQRLEITLPSAEGGDYTLRNLLNGREYRCIVKATARVEQSDSNGQLINTVELGEKTAVLAPSCITVESELLSKHYAGTKTIIGFLADGQTELGGTRYNPASPYYIKEYNEGLAQSKVLGAMPKTVRAIIEDQTGETTTYVQEIPVKWSLAATSSQYGSSYDFNETMALYRYAAAPDWDAINAQEQPDANGKKAAWYISQEAVGNAPWAKIGWNQEINSLVNAAGTVYTYNERTGLSEREQLDYLNANFPMVDVLVRDIMADGLEYKTISVPVTWKKVLVEEYDAGTEALVQRWTEEDQGDLQGRNAPMAKYTWEATIASDRYVVSGQLADVKPKAIFAWSSVINRIDAALSGGTNVSAVKLTSGSQLSGKIPTQLRVAFKDPLGQEDQEAVIPIASTRWLVDEGRYYNASAAYKWTTLSENGAVSTISTSAPAAVVRLKPNITDYTLTGNVEEENAKVWFQWGTIVTGVRTPEGTEFDLSSVGKQPYVTIKPDKGNRPWANVQNLSGFPKTMTVTVMDKSLTTDATQTITPTWAAPANYGPTADNGDYESFLTSWGSGIYLDEEVWKTLNGRVPYVRILWSTTDNLSNSASSAHMYYALKSGGNFDIKGAGGIKTSYGDNWIVVGKVDNNGEAALGTANNGVPVNFQGVQVTERLTLVNQETYIKFEIVVENTDSVPHRVGFSVCTDVQIASNDRADATIKETGFLMADSGSGKQFNLVTRGSYGVKDVDHMWVGAYSGYQGHKWDNMPVGSTYGGSDSALSFAWMPENHELAPGAKETFSVLFGVGGVANPPILRNNINAQISADKTKIEVTSEVKDDSGRQDTLYYVLDYGLDTQGSERSLKTATANGGWIPFNGTIEKPANWAEGEYHCIALWAMNEANAMTKLYTIPLVVKKEGGKEILALADAANVSFGNGADSRFTVSGTVPATIAAHVKESITLPSNTLTATNSFRFSGWKDNRTGTIYPAGAKYKIDHTSESLSAYWVSSNEIIYYLDIYEQELDGNYTLTSSTMRTGTKGGTISYNPPTKTGFQIDNAKSVLSVASVNNDSQHLKVYYARNRYNIVYDSNYAPGLPEVFKTVPNVVHGSTLSGIPTAANLNARENSRYFNFNGWKTARTGGAAASSNTVVSGNATYYAQWQPVVGTAKITFDYNYVNHAQNTTRSDVLDLNAVYLGAGHKYGYGAKASRMPTAPGNWKDKAGKTYAFMGWADENGNPVTADTVFAEFEPVTVYAQWKEAYEITCTYGGGSGSVSSNAPVVNGVRQPFGAGENATVTWAASAGYVVRHVYIDGALRDDLIGAGGIIFENLSDNHTVHVRFEQGDEEEEDPAKLTREIKTIAEGCSFINPESGVATVNLGDSYTVKWVPADGYKLSSVIVNDMPVQVSGTEFTFQNISSDQKISVTYEPDGSEPIVPRGPYHIQTKITNGAGITLPQTVEHGTDQEIIWDVPDGFFVRQVLVNHVPLNPMPAGNKYTFRNVIQDCSIEVVCQREQSEDPENSWLIKTIISNGTITRTSDAGEVKTGDSYRVAWSPADGYYVARIKIDGVWQGETVNGQFKANIFYEKLFENIAEDHEIEVECLAIEEEKLNHIETEIVNGGMINQPNDLPDGSSAVINWTVASGFKVVRVLLDGVPLIGEDGGLLIPDKSYTIHNISKDHSFTVVCERIQGGDEPVIPNPGEQYYTVSGRINVGTIDGQQSILAGQPCTVRWTPADGYHVKEVRVNGVLQSALTGTQWTIDAVTANTTIEVVCEETKAQTPVYTVEASIVNGGSITGGGVVPVGTNAKVSWTLAEGYQVKEVTLDGVPVSVGGQEYLFNGAAAAADHVYQLVVVCEPIPYYHVQVRSSNTASITNGADVKLGEDYTVSWTVPSGFRLKEVLVDGAAVAVSGSSYTVDGTAMTDGQICEIEVVCEQDIKHFVQTSIDCGGTITAPALVNEGSSMTVSWAPASGFKVAKVTVDGAERPDLLDASSVSFGQINREHSVVVECEEKITKFTIFAELINVESSTGAGVVSKGADRTVTWRGAEGFELDYVMVDGEKLDPAPEGSYTFRDVAEDHTIRIVFKAPERPEPGPDPEPETYYIQTSIDCGGTITPAVIVTQGVNDASQQITWAPADGYRVVKVLVDGAEDAGLLAGTSHTFANIGEDHSIEVKCEKIPSFTIATGAQNVKSITPTVSAVAEGAQVEITWEAAEGFVLSAVIVDGTPAALPSENKYVFEDVRADHSIRVEYKKQETPAEDPGYLIHTSAVNGVVAAPAHIVTAASGPVTVTWSPDEGYHVKSVLLNGVEQGTGSSSITFRYEDMGGDATLAVICEEDEKPEEYRVTTSLVPGGDGSITPSASVNKGDSFAVNWSVPFGYEISKVEKIVGGVSEDITAKVSGSYTFANIQADCELKVTCRKKDTAGGEVSDRFAYLTASISGGSITSPGGVRQRVKHGDSCTFTWEPNPGFYVADVLVDGVSVGLGDNYTFENVKDAHNVQVICESNQIHETYFVNVTARNADATSSSEIAVGTDYLVRWTARAGYHVEEVKVDGVLVEIGEDAKLSGSHLFTGALAGSTHTVVINCVRDEQEKKQFTITTSAENGRITESARPYEGDTVTIEWTPNFGYEVKEIVIDDTKRDVSLTEWTFEKVNADHSVKVVFGKMGEEPPAEDSEYVIQTKITNGASITSPITVKTAEEKAKQTVSWQPAEGFRVAKVLIDQLEQAQLLESGQVIFTNISANHVVEVICEKTETEPSTFEIAAETVNVKSVTGGGVVSKGARRTVTWQGTDGFVLDYVMVDGVKVTPATDTSYTFESVEADHTIKIVFKAPEKEAEIYYIQTSASAGGTITPAITVMKGVNDASQTVSWSPLDGYRIKRVLVDGRTVGVPASNSYEFTNIGADHTVHVECEKLPSYTISVNATNVASATASSASIREGDSFLVSWTPAEGMVLSKVLVDGAEVALSEGSTSYLFENVDANHSISIEYKKEDAPAEDPKQYTIRAAIVGGSISGSGDVPAGTKSRTVQWTPSAGFEVVKVTVDDVDWPQSKVDKAGGSITFENIYSDHSVSVECRLIGEAEKKYVTLDAGIENGKFNPQISVKRLEVGQNFDISWTPAAGYVVSSVVLDGEERNDLMVSGQLNLTAVSSNHVLRVVCKAADSKEDDPYKIYTEISNGTISDPFEAKGENLSYTVTWKADAGYKVETVLVDGVESTQAKADGFISFNPITSSHIVKVSCVKDPAIANKFTVNASIQNGSISKTPDMVAAGGEITVVWKAKPGFEIKSVSVDGSTFGGAFGTSLGDGSYSYTFRNITNDLHNIQVVCAEQKQTEPKTFKVSTMKSGGDGAVVSPSLPSVKEGERATVTWQVKPGWRITDVTLNGQSVGSETINQGQIAFEVYSDNDVVVYVQEHGSSSNAFVLVTTTINNGWISNGGSIQKNGDFDVRWIPDDGYHVAKVEITDAEGSKKTLSGQQLKNWNYTLENISCDTKVNVVCEKNEAGDTERNSYLVETTIRNGTINGERRVPAGQDCEIAWQAAEGYEVKSVVLKKSGVVFEDSRLDISKGKYQIRDIQEDWEVIVECELIPRGDEDIYTYNIETQISNGTINGPFTGLKKSDTKTVSWAPADGYEVQSVKVDGQLRQDLRGKNSVDIPVEADDHSVEVACVKKEAKPSEGAEQFLVKTYLYDGIGDITPWTNVGENEDCTISWKVSVDNHYKVAAVYIDGELTEKTENNVYTFENVSDKHTLEVYLEPNLVNIHVSYEGQGRVSDSASIFWGENYDVQGEPDSGWVLSSVTVDGRKLQPGETIEELVAGRRNIVRRAMRAAAQLFATETLQNEFAFSGVQQDHTIHYVFTPSSGAVQELAPHKVGVKFIGGTGALPATRTVKTGENVDLAWSINPGFYVDKVTVIRTGQENPIADTEGAELIDDNTAALTNVQADTTVVVYLKAGEKPDAAEANDFSLSIDIQGSSDPNNRVYGEGINLAPGDHVASWQIASGHHVTMVLVDGVADPTLLNKNQVTISMKREDTVRDHHVVIFVDGQVLPVLEKKAGGSADGAKAGDTIPYSILVGNESGDAIWTNAVLRDTLPEGLELQKATLKLYRITGTDEHPIKTEVTGAAIQYEESSRQISVNLGDLDNKARYELCFEAKISAGAYDAGLDIGNIARVDGQISGRPDQNVHAETGKVYPGGKEAVMPKAPAANIAKTVQSSDPEDDKTQVGDVLSYTIQVWNSTPDSVWKNVLVQDVLPEGFEMLPNGIRVTEIIGGTRQSITDRVSPQYDELNRIIMVSLGDLTHGRRYEISFDVVLTKDAMGVDIGNKASAIGRDADRNLVLAETKLVYPHEADKTQGVQPMDSKVRVYKRGLNLNHSNGVTVYGDSISYEIRVRNEGITASNLKLVDTLPEELELQKDGIYLIGPDGKGKKLKLKDIYDSDTRCITIELEQPLREGEEYWLTYRTVVVEAKNPGQKDKGVVNRVVVTGEDEEAAAIKVSAYSAIRYPVNEEELVKPPEEPENPGGNSGITVGGGDFAKTGDTANLALYGVLLAVFLLLCALLAGYLLKTKKKK